MRIANPIAVSLKKKETVVFVTSKMFAHYNTADTTIKQTNWKPLARGVHNICTKHLVCAMVITFLRTPFDFYQSKCVDIGAGLPLFLWTPDLFHESNQPREGEWCTLLGSEILVDANWAPHWGRVRKLQTNGTWFENEKWNGCKMSWTLRQAHPYDQWL